MRPTKKLQLSCKCKTCVHSMHKSNVGPCKDCQYTHDGKAHGGTIGTYHRTGKPIPTEINILEMRVEHLESMMVELISEYYFTRRRYKGRY